MTAVEILSLQFSYLQEVPQEIRKLSNLRLSLDKGVNIPPKVISSLSLLEELYINLTIKEPNASDSVTTKDTRTTDMTYFLYFCRRNLDFLLI